MKASRRIQTSDQWVIATSHTLQSDHLLCSILCLLIVAPAEIKGTRGDSLCVRVHVEPCSFSPAEVEQRSRGGGDAVSGPAQQVKLRQGSGLLRLDIFQVEATHQEVLTPDVL